MSMLRPSHRFRSAGVTVRTHYYTAHPDERLAVVGNLPELGEWDPRRALVGTQIPADSSERERGLGGGGGGGGDRGGGGEGGGGGGVEGGGGGGGVRGGEG